MAKLRGGEDAIRNTMLSLAGSFGFGGRTVGGVGVARGETRGLCELSFGSEHNGDFDGNIIYILLGRKSCD